MKGIKGSLKEKIAILRLKQGDTEAFGYLYDIYVDKIYRYIYFRVSDKSLAYDITQEVFLETWEYIVGERQIGSIQSFVYKVAYHKVVDFYRKKERQAALIEDMDDSDMEKVSLPDASVNAELQILKKHIYRLKPEHQDLILLKHVEGLSIKEIADIVGKEPNNIRVTLHRAMNALKERYSTNKQ